VTPRKTPDPPPDPAPPSEPGAAREAPKRRRSYKRLALEVAVVVGLLLAVRAYQSRDAASGPAPALRGRTVAGESVDLAALRGPTLVHFWATWCGVCRAEEGTIDALADGHRVITVASQSGPPPRVAAYLRERGLRFAALADPRGELARRWGVRAFPTSFVVDGRGNIRHAEVGYTTSLGLRARLWLADIL
jgi:thiol-disulfide isomerase/thioredoxin